MDGIDIGIVDINNNGDLKISFSLTATQEQINASIRQITYFNSSSNPDSSVLLTWIFSNGSISHPSSVSGSSLINILSVNDAPTLTKLTSVVTNGNEDTRITISMADIATQSNATDVDGTIVGYVVKAVSSGTLLIGTSSGTAVAWTVGTNDTIDATHFAYWTPTLNANGNLDVFTVVAKDNGGLESATAIQAKISVANLNDAPTGTVTISGTPTQGQILTASNTLADADGLGTITYSWYASGSAVSIGTGSTFTLTQAQVGKTITVVASYTDLLGTAESVSSLVTSAIVGLIVTPQTFVSTIANETFTAVTTNDTVSYVNATAGVTLSLLSTVAQNNVAAGMGSDTLVGIANLIGGGFNDTLTGNANNNVLSGGAGVDSLLGGLGTNTLTGGTGIDTFTVTGTDTIIDLGNGA